MPARKENVRQNQQQNRKPVQKAAEKPASALFPSGKMDQETRDAYAAMMAAHGDKAVEKARRPMGPVDMTPKPSPVTLDPLERPVPAEAKPEPVPQVAIEPLPEPTPMRPPVSFAEAYRTDTGKNKGNGIRRGKMNEFVNALNGVSATAVYTVKLSDGRELSFESPKVRVQKTLNQILSANEDDPAAQYIAQLGLLDAVCLTKGVDWNSITDFDRNKIMFSLYRDILFRDEYKYKCDDPECGFEWMGKLDGKKIIEKLDASDVSCKTVTKTVDGIDYKLRVGFPLAKAMVSFLTDFGERKRAEKNASGEAQIDAATLVEYIDLFVREIWVSKDGEEVAHVNIDEMFDVSGTQATDENGNPVYDDMGNPVDVDLGQGYRDAMEVLGSLPSAVLAANSDSDVYSRISKLLVETVNNALPDCVCPKCGHRMGKAFGFNDFFSRG